VPEHPHENWHEDGTGAPPTPRGLVEDRVRYLREETDFLLTVFETLTEYAIVAADFDGNVLAYNEGARRLYGYAPEEVIGRFKVEDLFPPAFARGGGLGERIRDLMDGGRVTFDTDKRCKDGGTFPAHVHLVLTRDRAANVVGFVEVVQDLTERLRAEAAVKRASAQGLLAHLVENARYDMIFVASPEGRVLECNAVARDTFRESRTGMRDLGMGDLLDFGAGSQWRDVAYYVASEGHWRGTVTGLARGGASFPAEVTVSRPPGEEHMICVVRDVSREKEIDRMKSEFIAVASNELRSPLTSIKNAVDIILAAKAGPVSGAQEKFLRMAERNIDRVNKLVGDLLDLSKIEAGRIRLAPADLSAPAVMDRVAATLRPLADRKGVALRTEVPDGLPPFRADPARTEQVLINLGDNAVKFTSAGGTVTFRAARGERFIEWSVSDTGVGVPPDQAAHLFERFYQAEATLSGEPRAGTGLGLSICKEIVESHGGTIAVESVPGHGTTFRFTLPLADRETACVQGLESRLAAARRLHLPLSVLVVHVPGFDRFRQAEGEEAALALMGAVESSAARLRLRPSDAVDACPDRGEMILTLPDTGRDGVDTVRVRVDRALRQVREAFGGAVSPAVGAATFPEDGTDAGSLLAAARRAIAVPDLGTGAG
jgi:PAS domain S-box-containing protein